MLGCKQIDSPYCIYSWVSNTNVKLITQVSHISAQPTSCVTDIHPFEEKTSISAPEQGLVAMKMGEMRIRTSEPKNDTSIPAENFCIWVVETMDRIMCIFPRQPARNSHMTGRVVKKSAVQ